MGARGSVADACWTHITWRDQISMDKIMKSCPSLPRSTGHFQGSYYGPDVVMHTEDTAVNETDLSLPSQRLQSIRVTVISQMITWERK